MNIYRHWAKAQEKLPERGWLVSCFGDSNENEQDAHRQAKTRLQRILDAIRSGSNAARYEQYCDIPLREEVKEEYAAPGGRREAVLTRNGYGALVLNTERVMFMDLDLSSGSFWQWLKGLFGFSTQTPEEALRQRLSERLAEYPMLGLRLYRTTAGFRALVTSGPYDPVSAETQDMLKAFGNDPLYRMLCRKQACFRARVSPKPWRLKLPGPEQFIRVPVLTGPDLLPR